MKKSVILIGVGEMGGVFARGFLKAGHSVYPVTRGMALDKVSLEVPDPAAVVVAVAEKDLQDVLGSLSDRWHDRLVFLQNELLPGDWEKHGILDPTVISVWFEKKPPNDFKPIIPSLIFGPKAAMIDAALASLKIPCKVLKSRDELVFELVLKNVYILTTNIAGLEVGGNVGTLWDKHQSFAREVANDVIDIQFRLIGKELDREKLIEGMVAAFQGDPEHKCMGRSALARLQRVLSQADEAGLEVQTLRDIFVKADSLRQK